VVEDHRYVSFMYSYFNYVPLLGPPSDGLSSGSSLLDTTASTGALLGGDKRRAGCYRTLIDPVPARYRERISVCG
jgi:hypothetical protein